jgi:hypothetical protein
MHNEKLENLNSSPDLIMVIKSRRMGWNATYSTNGSDEKLIHNFGHKCYQDGS